ncbi:tRNA-splicing endonuclease subunit sen54 [Sorochytrium milnesiophthora]
MESERPTTPDQSSSSSSDGAPTTPERQLSQRPSVQELKSFYETCFTSEASPPSSSPSSAKPSRRASVVSARSSPDTTLEADTSAARAKQQTPDDTAYAPLPQGGEGTSGDSMVLGQELAATRQDDDDEETSTGDNVVAESEQSYASALEEEYDSDAQAAHSAALTVDLADEPSSIEGSEHWFTPHLKDGDDDTADEDAADDENDNEPAVSGLGEDLTPAPSPTPAPVLDVPEQAEELMPLIDKEQEDEQQAPDSEPEGVNYSDLLGSLKQKGKQQQQQQQQTASQADASVEDSSDALKAVLDGKRPIAMNTVSRAVWHPQRGVAEVVQPRGKHFEKMGTMLNSVLYLLPEEALYLLELGALELSYSPDAEDTHNMSLESAYSQLLGSDRDQLTIERYKVYANLKRSGFVLARGGYGFKKLVGAPPRALPQQQSGTERAAEQTATNSMSLWRMATFVPLLPIYVCVWYWTWVFGLVRTLLRECLLALTSTTTSMTHKALHERAQEIYQGIPQISSSASAPRQQEELATAVVNVFSDRPWDFDVWKPETRFRKATAGDAADYRVVVRREHEPMPAPHEITAMQGLSCALVNSRQPGTDGTADATSAGLLLAVVDAAGNTAFFDVADSNGIALNTTLATSK